jgi:uroporphyrinogen-III decarboxylase
LWFNFNNDFRIIERSFVNFYKWSEKMNRINDEINEYNKETKVLKILKTSSTMIEYYQKCLQNNISIDFAIYVKNKELIGAYDLVGGLI